MFTHGCVKKLFLIIWKIIVENKLYLYVSVYNVYTLGFYISTFCNNNVFIMFRFTLHFNVTQSAHYVIFKLYA